MFMNNYKAALGVLAKKPMMLWGLSLLMGILTIVASFATATIPFLSIAIGYLFACGSVKLYMDGLKGKEVNSKQLFAAFNKDAIKTAGAMAWKDLWTLIWSAVPIYGTVKAYSYRFVPYIVMTRPEISAFDALKLSMKLTNGKKLHMWLADIVFVIAPGVAMGILLGLSAIPVLGILFSLALAVLVLALLLFSNIFVGLYSAAFFSEEELDAAIAEMNAAEAVEETEAV
ncbi:MAG: hypothetical protein E7447_05530 [Ruminococcaceae bacterium]|nr:hypothetical protein [Oscillospiraceae bacterium]